jgi:hypothetical protein
VRKITSVLLSLFLMSCLITSANAVVTFGATSCGTWVANKSKNEADGWASIIDHYWLMGYLGGLATYSNADVLKDRDSNSIFLWVDNYCQINPLKNSADAGIDLFLELKKQKGLK